MFYGTNGYEINSNQDKKYISNKKGILVFPGDGIGIETTDQAIKVLKALKFPLPLTIVDWGVERYKKTGSICPDNYLEILDQYDVCLFGALGNPEVLPDHITLKPLLEMRQKLNQSICVRPVSSMEGIKNPINKKFDIAVVRENSEGEYVQVGGIVGNGENEIAVETAMHSRRAITRIIKYAFKLAEGRNKKVTLATKSNALKYSMVLWDKIFEEIRQEYKHIKSEKIHVDALSMKFVLHPEDLDVVVGSNLFCDILSDLGGAIAGSLGIAASSNLNIDKTHCSLFEPVHGSALDIAGKDVANPIGSIRCTAMMIDFLGFKKEAQIIEDAVRAIIKEKKVTVDLGGKLKCSEVGDEVAKLVAKMVNE